MFLCGDGGGRTYGCGVGIEIWAVIALITVLSVYLLPLLVGRREMTRRSNVQDRYSAELRVLATGAHRGIVASVLLGVSLGAWVLGLVTALPWWPALLPSALLGASMVAGRRAALASAAADRRERRRIAELEQTLVTLTGRRSSASVVAAPRSVVDGPRSASSGAGSTVSASAASPACGASGK